MDTYTTELAAWAAVVGVLLPLAISMVNLAHWTSRTRSAVAAGLSVVAALGTVHFANPGGIETQPAIITIAAVLTLAGSTYRTIWKPSGIAETVEEATEWAEPGEG